MVPFRIVFGQLRHLFYCRLTHSVLAICLDLVARNLVCQVLLLYFAVVFIPSLFIFADKKESW